MRRALQLALEGWGRVQPNPLVGAVVARGARVIGEGYHAEWGGPHAEIAALGAAGAASDGATLYVNLEPCNHAGKTLPCSVAIRDAGVARVVYAVLDPNPAAAGGGAWLRSQGLEVSEGMCDHEARELNAAHFKSIEGDRPFVALKYALSLDGRLSEAPGVESRVTSRQAVCEAHRLRAGSDCVMVGIGTVLADDPELTVRHWREPRVAPIRVVCDSDLRIPLDSKLVASARDVPLLVFSGEPADAGRCSALERLGVDVHRVASGSAGLELLAVLRALGERGVRSVLCEGGGALGSSLLGVGLVDRIYAFIAPILFGASGVAAFQGGVAQREWRVVERRELGPDTLFVLSASPPPEGARDSEGQ